jgi:hypothetical protein
VQQEQRRCVNRTWACRPCKVNDWRFGNGIHHGDDRQSRAAACRRLRPDNLAGGAVDGVASVMVVFSNGMIVWQRAHVSDQRQSQHHQNSDDQPVAAPPCRLHARQITASAHACPPNRLVTIQLPDRVRAASARTKKLPSLTTRSPGFRPEMTSTVSPAGVPTLTARSTKRPDSPSTAT